jgi:sec-independent protein translocase protein TatC
MDVPRSIIEHLSELRKRIIICLATLCIAATISFPFASNVLYVLKLPASGMVERLAFFSPQEAFLIYMRVVFISGLVISMPVIFYQFWLFVAPAMDERFKRHALSFIFYSFLAFISGCLFAYLVLVPQALRFLLSFASEELEPIISASKYISFTVGLVLGTGLVFLMPVLSFVLTKVGIFTHRFLRKKYKYAIVLIVIIAAVVTPTADAFNMFILALPMLFLYELSIWISFIAGKNKKEG